MKLSRVLTLSFLLASLLVTGLLAPPSQAELDEEIPFEMVETPTQVKDLVALFARLEFSMVDLEDGNITRDMKLEYRYEGREEVEGVEVDRVAFRASEGIDPIDIWVDEGEIVQLEVGGQTIPPGMVDMMSDAFQFIFFPFYFYEQLQLKGIQDAGTVQVTEKRGEVGGQTLDIIEVELQEPIVESGLQSGFIRFAEFEEYLMLAEYNFQTLDESEHRFKVESFELR